ncbi:ATP-dependent DNA helicase [Trichonephila inaurata madagascariensis]|uniref:ATP-dependent DNA helicase n=1 Tax=Trichonephila inaurata madagascariensis TaxID=2747483 RepID=A0A8X6YG01_9ARAC|nr:ATP-dependent DNA helicase [Trichonephila inaurata madagascariensis]
MDSSNILFHQKPAQMTLKPNFKCKNVGSAGVAIYQKSNDVSNIVTSNMDILLQYIRKIVIGQSSMGDIGAAQSVLVDGTNIIMVVVYIWTNNTVNIIKFLYKRHDLRSSRL